MYTELDNHIKHFEVIIIIKKHPHNYRIILSALKTNNINNLAFEASLQSVHFIYFFSFFSILLSSSSFFFTSTSSNYVIMLIIYSDQVIESFLFWYLTI